jgi:hypothetical protein
MSPREIGHVHSRYAVRHAHSLFVHARLAGEAAMLARDLKVEEAKFRTLHKSDFKTKWELDDAILLDEEMMELRDRLTVAEIQEGIVEGLSKGYEGLTRAASREISRRASEQAPRD